MKKKAVVAAVEELHRLQPETSFHPERISNKANGQDAAAVHITIPDTPSLSKYVPWRGIVGAAFIQMRKAITLHSSSGYMRNHISPGWAHYVPRAGLIFPSIKRKANTRGWKAAAFKLHFHCGPYNAEMSFHCELKEAGRCSVGDGRHINFYGSVPCNNAAALYT